MKIKFNIKFAVILYILVPVTIALIMLYLINSIKNDYSVPIFDYASKDSVLISEIGKVIYVSDNLGFESFNLNDTTYCVVLWVIGEKADAKIQVYGDKSEIKNWKIYSLDILNKRYK